jgi:hypothetical protein
LKLLVQCHECHKQVGVLDVRPQILVSNSQHAIGEVAGDNSTSKTKSFTFPQAFSTLFALKGPMRKRR